jgi:hypothetical protein
MEYKHRVKIGKYLSIALSGDNKECAILLHQNTLVKTLDNNDKIERKLFIIEAIKLGANKSPLANALGISRQTIDNYLDVYKYFGIEGLIHSYSPKKSKRIRTHRENSAQKRQLGNKTKEIHDHIKQEKAKQKQLILPLEEPEVEQEEQPYHQEHEWAFSRYAGVFVYIITLIGQYDWIKFIQGYFGSGYKLFLALLLMVARNIRSIEQFKNIRLKEASRLLGVNELPSRKRIRQWLSQTSELGIASHMLNCFFRHQIRVGIVGLWLWSTDGHLLPYTGKEKLRPAYNTQRRLMVPGRTNMVTTDHTGRIVDFQIQEGKGNLKDRIIALDLKWRDEVPGAIVHVFDREGDGKDFFFNLSALGIQFVTWEKNVDSQKLKALPAEAFTEELQLNRKKYCIFEGEKQYVIEVDGIEVTLRLRRIYIWNTNSNKRTCGLSNVCKQKMSTRECAVAILNRWGISENTFKHLNERHPLHNEPSFNMAESQYQEIANPELKSKKTILAQIRSSLNSMYKKLSKTKQVFNKDGSPRKKSARSNLEQKIAHKENELETLHKEIKETPGRIDCSQEDAYKNFKCINNESKNLYDFVLSSAWNARKQMVEWLRPIYGNKNEYVDLFYAITRCHGWIQSDPEKVTVRLEPLEQPSRRAAQEQFCRKLSSLKARTPAGKLLRIEVGKTPM